MHIYQLQVTQQSAIVIVGIAQLHYLTLSNILVALKCYFSLPNTWKHLLDTTQLAENSTGRPTLPQMSTKQTKPLNTTSERLKLLSWEKPNMKTTESIRFPLGFHFDCSMLLGWRCAFGTRAHFSENSKQKIISCSFELSYQNMLHRAFSAEKVEKWNVSL